MENVSLVMVGPLSTWFVRRVLQVRRSLGPDHSLNTPRRTCRGIIHCLYLPLLSSPCTSPSFFFVRSRFSISFLLLRSSLFSLLACGEPLATRSKRAISLLLPPARSSITRYRNSPVYPSSRLRGVNLDTSFELRIMRYFWKKGEFLWHRKVRQKR